MDKGMKTGRAIALVMAAALCLGMAASGCAAVSDTPGGTGTLDMSELAVSDVEGITLLSYNKEDEAELDEEDVRDIVLMLNHVGSTEYGSDQFKQKNGLQSRMFRISLQDGESFWFAASDPHSGDPYYIIDDECWLGDSWLCNILYQMWYRLVDEYFERPETSLEALDMSGLTVSDIESVTLLSYDNETEAELDEEDVAEVVSMLDDVSSTRYGSDDYVFLDGLQSRMFRISLQDGESFWFGAGDPYYVIDGECWNGDSSICHSLHSLWVGLVDKYFGWPESLPYTLDMSGLSVPDIESITIISYDHADEAELDEEETAEVVSMLNDVRSTEYGSNQHEHIVGGYGPMFRVSLQDGESFVFSASDPFYIIDDDECWFADHSVCDALYQLWIDLVDEYFGWPDVPDIT